MSLSQNDLDWLAARLSLAVYDTNRETPEMSVLELKEALRDVPGIETLTVSYTSNGNQLIYCNGQFLEVGPMASNEEIRIALQHPTIRTENTKIMSITGIQAGSFQAKLAEMKQKMVDKQNQALSRIDGKVTEGHAKMDAAVDGVTAKMDKEIDDALHEFAQSTNGGPA